MNKKHIVSLLSALAVYLFLSACAPSASFSPDIPPNPNSDPNLEVLRNPRFEIEPSPNQLQTNNFWIRKEDQIAPRWEQFSLFRKEPNVTCDFINPREGCIRCDACAPLNRDLCRGSVNFPPGVSAIEVVTCPGFMCSMSATTEAVNIASGCPNSSQVSKFKPEANVLYQLKLGQLFSGNESLLKAVTKVHVIADGGTEPATYQLEFFREERVPDPNDPNQTIVKKITFITTVPIVMGKHLDNFSDKLSIGKIRIGTSTNDPATGDLKLNGIEILKPTRIFFGQGADPDDNDFCFARYPGDEGEQDGDIDLAECRRTKQKKDALCPPDSPNREECIRTNFPARPVTPLYDLDFSKRNAVLTWVVEFNENDFDVFENRADGQMPMRRNDLAIEFTIK